MSQQVKGIELALGDIVLCSAHGETYNCATVKQLSEHEVTLFRPYVHTEDFSYTGGILCFIGIEEFKASRSGTFTLLRRKGPIR